MPNTHTTKASFSARMTDEKILEEAAWTSRMGHRGTAAVLRDYVRLRKLVNEDNPLEKLARELGMFADFNKVADRVNGYVVTKAKQVIEKLAEVASGHWENICDGPPAYICDAGDLRVQCCIGHCVDIAAGKEAK